MTTSKYYFAVDLGATSGRTILGRISDGRVETEELTRFPNNIVLYGRHSYWDLMALYSEVIRGLRTVAQRGIELQSIGIDTWGCDVVLVSGGDTFPRNPRAYRDATLPPHQHHFLSNVMSQQQLYQLTGIQLMPFNTVFQLYAYAQEQPRVMADTEKVLFMPDALSYLLTGQAVCEYTVASTSGMVNAHTRDLDPTILQALGLRREMFGPMVQPATTIGTLTPDVQRLTGLSAVPVVAVPGHDTASAVAAVPARDAHFAYLSSGTWSLMGIESETPIINNVSQERNFTNEGGIEGTTRFLKNICGMWIYESCRREWPEEVRQQGHGALIEQAKRSCINSIINPDDESFANPASMLQAIDAYCARTGQQVPQTVGEYCHVIFHSLAHRYAQVFAWLQEQAHTSIDRLHIIGGGAMNAYLNQLTADALGTTVVAGPQECTALGNIMMQAKAAGEVADMWQMRQVIARSVQTKEFLPAK